jgi:plasmid stabilization system protein ParE
VTRLRWAPRSRLDIRQIEAWLDQQDPLLAGRIVDAIETKVDQLLAFPFSGPPIGDGGVRRLSIPRFGYAIIYRTNGDMVEIIRVRHAHEDWSPL